MSRKTVIFCLTHGYPVFIAMHLYFGDWCRRCQLLFNIVPMVVFGGLLFVWQHTSHIRLTKTEQLCINYLVYNLLFIYTYYCICVISVSVWVYDKNWQASTFVLITLLFYAFNYRERK